MKKIIFLIISVSLISSACFAQEKEKTKEKKTVKEVLDELPEMLIAQPDAAPDTNANKLTNDNVSIIVDPLWREKGALTLFEFKLNKTDVEPLNNTFPLPDKKIVQALSIGLGTVKKSVEVKKQEVLNGIKNHISAYYKEMGESISSQDIISKTNSMLISSEEFTTNEGKKGTLFYLHDIQTTKSNFIVLFLLPGANANLSHFAQFSYARFTYETNLPEDLLELRVFVYPDEQQTYIDFTKEILKTLRVK